jgi:hypothetical protein
LKKNSYEENITVILVHTEPHSAGAAKKARSFPKNNTNADRHYDGPGAGWELPRTRTDKFELNFANGQMI